MYSISINITINQWFWGFTLLHPAPFPALLWIITFQSKLPTAQPRLKSSFGRIFAREADDAVLWVAIQLPWEGNSFPPRSGNVCNVLQLCHHFDLVQCVFWSNDSAKNKDRCQHHAVVKGQKQGRAQVNLVLGVGVAIVGFHQGQVNCIQQCQERAQAQKPHHSGGRLGKLFVNNLWQQPLLHVRFVQQNESTHCWDEALTGVEENDNEKVHGAPEDGVRDHNSDEAAGHQPPEPSPEADPARAAPAKGVEL